LVTKDCGMNSFLWNSETLECFLRAKVCDAQSQMISVKYADVPFFLQGGAFYKALSDDDKSDELQLSNKFFCADDKVKNFPALLHMLDVMTFWSVDTIPDGVVDFCNYCYHWDRERIQHILNNTNEEVDILSELNQIFCSDDPLKMAIRTDRTEVVKYLAKQRTNCSDPDIVALAAFKGNLSYLKILRLHEYEWSPKACKNAALKGHLDCLRYLHENGCEWNCQVYACAGYTNQWDCFTYAFESGLPWEYGVSSALIQCKNSVFLKFAIENGCPISTLAVEAAAQFGSVECLQMLLNAGCPVPTDACLIACRGVNIQCLQFLHEYGASWDEKAPATAAINDGLSCIQYLHEQGCPWNEKTTEEAARYGRYNSLKYAMENGCPYHNSIVVTAAWGESPMACLQYLIEEQGLYMGNNGGVFEAAIRMCKPVVVQYLIDQGYNIHYRTETLSKMLMYTDWCYEMKPSFDEPLLECIKIALQHNWDIHRQAPALLREVVRFSSEVPLLYAYLQAEGYVE